MSDLETVAAEVVTFWAPMDTTGAFRSPDKLMDEMREFLKAPSPEEAADVVTAAINWFHANGWSLAEFVQRKNEINRLRKWRQLPNGHFQHIEESA